MTPIQATSIAMDQLINQIIHQGKAQRNAAYCVGCGEQLSVDGYQLRPVPGSRDYNSTNPKGRAFRKVRPSKAQPYLERRKRRGFNIRSGNLSITESITWEGV